LALRKQKFAGVKRKVVGPSMVLALLSVGRAIEEELGEV
jgi:hypothetical protein